MLGYVESVPKNAKCSLNWDTSKQKKNVSNSINKGCAQTNVKEKEIELQEKRRQKKKKIGKDLDSWHLHIVVFLFSSESYSLCKTKSFDSSATQQARKTLVIFAN